jgi:hypothetical protein
VGIESFISNSDEQKVKVAQVQMATETEHAHPDCEEHTTKAMGCSTFGRSAKNDAHF